MVNTYAVIENYDVKNIILLKDEDKDVYCEHALNANEMLIPIIEGENICVGDVYDAENNVFYNPNDEEETPEEISFLQKIGRWFGGS